MKDESILLCRWSFVVVAVIQYIHTTYLLTLHDTYSIQVTGKGRASQKYQNKQTETLKI